MLYVENDNTIRLTRGDTAKLVISITSDTTNDEYTIEDTDTLTFTVRRKTCDPEILIQKTVTGTGSIDLEPSDTDGMCPTAYVYDVQLDKTNGDVFTVIPPTTFRLLPEVTY